MEGGDEELRGVQTLSWCWREQEEDEEGEEERDGGKRRGASSCTCVFIIMQIRSDIRSLHNSWNRVTGGAGAQRGSSPPPQPPNQPRLLRFPVRVGPPRLTCSVPRAGIILANFCASLCPDDRCLCDCSIDHRVNYSSILIKADGHVEECTFVPLNLLKERFCWFKNETNKRSELKVSL